MRNYTTQMDAARKGILTPEMKTVAKKERMPEEQLVWETTAEERITAYCRETAARLAPGPAPADRQRRRRRFTLIMGEDTGRIPRGE